MFQPFGNTSTLPPASWHPEPNFRGTFNVLSTSLLTMSLCIWTAVHLNLPEHKKEHLQKWRKLGWLVMGLLAPELVVWNAYEQRRVVKWLTREIREIHESQYHIPMRKPKRWRDNVQSIYRRSNPLKWLSRIWHKLKVALLLQAGELEECWQEKLREKHEKEDALSTWTDLHSWYAVMGGFAFDTKNADVPFLPEGRERAVLTPEGMVFLAKHWPDQIPIMSSEDLRDRSKSDGLGKLVTFWQAGWFCIQCVFRLSQGLSISLLELNVFAHAACALVLFLVWWEKPLDVQEPTKLAGDSSYPLAALFCTMSPVGAVGVRSKYQRIKDVRKKPDWDVWDMFEQTMIITERYFWIPSQANAECHWLPNSVGTAAYRMEGLIESGSLRIGDTYWCLRCSYSDIETPVGSLVLVDRPMVARLQAILPRDRHFLEEACPRSRSKQHPKNWSSRPLVSARSSNWSPSLGKWLDNVGESSRTAFGLTVATVLYGGLHAAAWNAPFPTRIERLLWQISSLTVAFTLLSYVVIWILCWTVDWLDECGLGMVTPDVLRRVVRLLFLILFVVFVGSIPWYCFCRGFLVVESFINVAHLSQAVLSVPNWSQYVPHVT